MRSRRTMRFVALAALCLSVGACANGRGIFLAGLGANPPPASPQDEDDDERADRPQAILAASGTAWLGWSQDPARDVLLDHLVANPTTAPSSGVASLTTGALTAARTSPAALAITGLDGRPTAVLGLPGGPGRPAAPGAVTARLAPQLTAGAASTQLLVNLGGVATRATVQAPGTPPLLPPAPGLPGVQPLQQLLNRITAPATGGSGGLACGLLPCPGGG